MAQGAGVNPGFVPSFITGASDASTLAYKSTRDSASPLIQQAEHLVRHKIDLGAPLPPYWYTQHLPNISAALLLVCICMVCVVMAFIIAAVFYRRPEVSALPTAIADERGMALFDATSPPSRPSHLTAVAIDAPATANRGVNAATSASIQIKVTTTWKLGHVPDHYEVTLTDGEYSETKVTQHHLTTFYINALQLYAGSHAWQASVVWAGREYGGTATTTVVQIAS